MGRYSNRNMKNNVHATLSTALSSIATTIQLTSGQGSRFGTIFPQLATIESIQDGKVTKREIVQITARNGDNLTVVRAFAPCPENDDANSQSQQSISFNADDTISMYITKEHFDQVADGFDNVDNSFDDVYENGTDELRTYKTTGLGIQVKPGKVLVGSSYYDFEGGTLTLTDDATNYVEIDEDGNLVSNTTGRNDDNSKISIVTTSGGNVTNINNRRLGTVGGKLGGTNIHDLTEKTILSVDDEFIITDSENIFQNKKATFGNLFFCVHNVMNEPTGLTLVQIDDTHLGVKYTDPTIGTGPRTIPESKNNRAKSYIYMKEGSAPTGPEDGTIINTSTSKNQYSSNPFSATIEEGKNYYFRIVSEANNGVKTYGDYKLFSTTKYIEFLLVAGGGAGGPCYAARYGNSYPNGGGGGAGGLKYMSKAYVTPGTYPVVIGVGGEQRFGNETSADPGGIPDTAKGGNSSFLGFTMIGGGYGGSASSGNSASNTRAKKGGNGGSGGGGGGNFVNSWTNRGYGGSGTSGQGYGGGYGSGGGGGAGGAGGTVPSGQQYWSNAAGGPGFVSDISGTSVEYAKGGAGPTTRAQGADGNTYGSGGQGGAGDYYQSNFKGGNGMQGILIVRYLTSSGIVATGGTITTSGNYTIHTFTSDGNFVIS